MARFQLREPARFHQPPFKPCAVEGAVVNLASAFGEARPGFYLKDNSGGILVWHATNAVVIGDRPRVSGQRSQSRNARTEMEAAAVDRHTFDLVFLYIQMPEMVGLEAARRIRGQLRLRDRPWLVALTAKAMTSDRDECVAAGMNDRVAKPIGLKQLAAALEWAEAGLQGANDFPAMETQRARGAGAGGAL